MFQVTDADFEKEVLQSDIPVVVDFWAEWCGPCRMIEPTVEELAKDYEGKVKIVKLNVDDNPMTSAQLGIRSIPTLMFFKDGEKVDMIIGAQSKAAMAKKIDGLL